MRACNIHDTLLQILPNRHGSYRIYGRTQYDRHYNKWFRVPSTTGTTSSPISGHQEHRYSRHSQIFHLHKLYRYAREIHTYVENHGLKQRAFSDCEMISIFLSHLDDSHYSPAIKECEMAILHATIIPAIYLVSAIAGTVDQIAPQPATKINEPAPP